MNTLKAWYDKHFIPNLLKTFTFWAAIIAAALPDLLQTGLDNIDLVFNVATPFLSDASKSKLQLFLILIIIPLRAWRQKSVAPKSLEAKV
jgi:hypothetical protein